MNQGYSSFKLPASSNSIDINVSGLKQCLAKSDNPKLCIKDNVKVPIRTKMYLKAKMRKLKEMAMKNKPQMVQQAEALMKQAVQMENKAKVESRNEMEHKAKKKHISGLRNHATTGWVRLSEKEQ